MRWSSSTRPSTGTTATTYINDNIVVCVLENILTGDEDTLIADSARGEVIDGRVISRSRS
jgi:hypothetical protein